MRESLLTDMEGWDGMKKAGMNMAQVKRRNRSSILNCVNQCQPVSRKDIAGLIGLTPAAVTQICGELIQEGLLEEQGFETQAAGAGRRKILLSLNYNCYYVMTVNVEAGNTCLAISNMKGDCVEQQTIPTERGEEPEAFLARTAESCRQMAEKHGDIRPRIAGVSVAVPGVVDKERGISVHAYGVWPREVDVRGILEERLHCPVWLENNVNALAAAELLYGYGRSYDNLLLVKWGPGVGSTIIIDGQLYEGRHGKAGELGHFIVEQNGELCSCGRRGCLETRVSYQALSRQFPFAQEEFGDACRKAAAVGKAEVFREAIEMFARAIVNSMTILAPNRVVLCGSLFRDSEIRSRLIEACCRYEPKYNAERILYSELADREKYIGPTAVFVRSVL